MPRKNIPKPEPNEEIVPVPLQLIRPGDNDRTVFDPNEIAELAANIQAQGQHTAAILRPIQHPTYQFEIVAGERRFRACTLLGKETLNAVIRNLTDEQADAIMLSENFDRQDLDPLDEAHAFAKRIEKYGWSIAECAERCNTNPRHVDAMLSLLRLVPEAQQMLRNQQITVGFGETMAPLDANRQRIALQYLSQTEKPLLREFKALCGKLLAEQAQESLFDFEMLATAALDAVDAHNLERAAMLKRRFPIDEHIPHMERAGSIGATFETYIKQLLISDDPYHRQVAPVVGTIYESLLRGGMAFPPGTSPKRREK